MGRSPTGLLGWEPEAWGDGVGLHSKRGGRREGSEGRVKSCFGHIEFHTSTGHAV